MTATDVSSSSSGPAATTAARHRVVVTGMGIASPLGNSIDEFWDALLSGRQAFDYHPELPDTLVAPVPDDGWEKAFSGRNRRYTSRCTRLALHAARQAIAEAGIDTTPRTGRHARKSPGEGAAVADPRLETAGVYVGSSIGGIESIWEDFGACAVDRTAESMTPFVLPRCLINMVPANLSIEFGIGGESVGLAAACASGTVALGEAYRRVADGTVPMAVAGGAEGSLIPTVITPFQKVGAMTRSTDPDHALRPFASDRDGFLMGEGAAMFVLERADAADERGATVLGEIVGYHSTSDAHSLLAPDVDGVRRAVAGLFTTTGLEPERVGYVNAHGTGTERNDQVEAEVFAEVLAHGPVVSSTKANYGHPLGAAGAFEAVTCLKVLATGTVPGMPNLGRDDIEPGFKLNLALREPTTIEPGSLAVSTSFAFGGQNAVLAFA